MFFVIVLTIASLLANIWMVMRVFFHIDKDPELYQKKIKEETDYLFIKGLY